MKRTLLLAVSVFSFVSMSAAHAYINTNIDLNEIDCYKTISNITCNSNGYLSGHNYTSCKFSLSYKSIYSDRAFKIKTVESFAYHVTDTGLAGWATLGLADAVVNQRNAIKARTEARRDLNFKIKEIKTHLEKCY